MSRFPTDYIYYFFYLNFNTKQGVVFVGNENTYWSLINKWLDNQSINFAANREKGEGLRNIQYTGTWNYFALASWQVSIYWLDVYVLILLPSFWLQIENK